MITSDALIVGGGPAGSTCAAALRRAGWDVIVADRAAFPRDTVCAGWVTPAVFRLLDLAAADYRAAGLTLQKIRGFRTGAFGQPQIDTRHPGVVSYAIRRCQFDAFLRRRSRATTFRSSTSVRSGRLLVARRLLRSAVFTRHVVLDRWFLRPDALAATAAS